MNMNTVFPLTEWQQTDVGKVFKSLGFHMFTIDQYLSRLEDEGSKVIRLTLGKSDRPLSQNVKEAMINAMDTPEDILRVDSEGNNKLREDVAKYYNRRFDASIQSDDIIIGSQGTSSLYRDIFTLLLQDGGEVLLPRPGYILYEASARLMQAICKHLIEIKYYDINLETNTIDIDSLKKNFNADKNRIIVFNSPGNPTGNLISKMDWESAIDMINSGKRSIMISDQVYSNILFNGRPYVSILDKDLREMIRRPYIVTDSMSKGFEMYTFRVGFAIIPEELKTPLISFQRNFSLTPPTISQFGAIAALNQDQRVKELEELYQKRNDYLCKTLKAIPDIRVLESDGGFYCIIKCGSFMRKHGIESDLDLAFDIANKTDPHVGTTPCSDFGIPDCLRISFSPENFELGVDGLAGYFSK